jgi:hypothetical protein
MRRANSTTCKITHLWQSLQCICTHAHINIFEISSTDAWLIFFRQAAFTPCPCDFFLFVFVLCHDLLPHVHLFQVISYCCRQPSIPPPAREFSCNANVTVSTNIHGNCKSPNIFSYLVYGVLQGLTVITNHSQLFTEFGNFAEK